MPNVFKRNMSVINSGKNNNLCNYKKKQATRGV